MSFDVIQAKNLTPRYLGRLARTASGGKFRRLRYFRASFPHRTALVITLRFEDGENQTSVSVSPNSWMHIMHEDFPAVPAKPSYTAETLEDYRQIPSDRIKRVYDSEGTEWTAGHLFGWFSKRVSAADAITSETLVRDYGPITN